MECETGGINWTSLFKYPGLMLLLKPLKKCVCCYGIQKLPSFYLSVLPQYVLLCRQTKPGVTSCFALYAMLLCLPTEPYKNPKQNMLSIYSPPLTLHRRVEVSGLVSFYKFCGRGEREVSVKKWKAVNSVQAILGAIKFRETTPNRNTPILVHVLVSGNHQLWTQNYW